MLLKHRPDIAVRGRSLIQMSGGRTKFGLHPALAALKPMLTAGKIAAVPDISTPQLTRSHFQAQELLERGGSDAGTDGWLNRVLNQMGAGTTFRSMSVTSSLTRSLVGENKSLVANRPDALELPDGKENAAVVTKALTDLYDGVDHPYAVQSMIALEASTHVATIQAAAGKNGDQRFGTDDFGRDLGLLSALVKSKVGVRIATMDVGGWDMHTGIGTVDQGDMQRNLKPLGDGLAAFLKDLGEMADEVTVVVMSEFGRRAEQNGSGGTDHGHGGLALVLGGGVKGGVHGDWKGLDPKVLDEGDLPGSSDHRDLLGEVVMSRMGHAGQGAKVFPGWKVSAKGVMVPG